MTVRLLQIETESDGDDPLTTKLLVERAFSEAAAAGLGRTTSSQITQGGTKTMTAGMILACTGRTGSFSS